MSAAGASGGAIGGASGPRPRWQSNEGTQRGERLPAALADGYFNVDEMDLARLAAMSAAFSEHVAFYHSKDRRDGNWRPWFDAEEVFVMADIATFDVESQRAAFLRIADSAPEEIPHLRSLALARRVDRWHRALQKLGQHASAELALQIEHVAKSRLALDLAWAAGARNAGAGADEPGFPRRVAGELAGELWKPYEDAVPHTRARPSGRSIFFSFLDAIARLQDAARSRIAESLRADTHEASAALFLAFLQLFEAVQKRVNAFTARHTDFYYRDCLHMRARAGTPESVHLVCTRVPGVDVEVVVPRGAAFVLGRDAAGEDVVYRADETLEVTPVEVSRLCTLRLERERLISPARELDHVTYARADRLGRGADPNAGGAARPYWPLFGGRGLAGTAGHAELGLAIASPLFLLAEGRREIRVRLALAHAGDLDARALEAVLRFAEGAGAGGTDLRPGFARLLHACFERFAVLEREGVSGAGARPHADSRRTRALAAALTRAATPGVAARVLIARLHGLSAAEREALRRALKAAAHAAVVRTTSGLGAELKAEIERVLRELVEHPVALTLTFEVRREVRDGVQLQVAGADALPAGSDIARARDDLRAIYSGFLLQQLLQAKTEQAFFTRFGRLYCRWMLVDPQALFACDVDAIRKLRESLCDGDDADSHGLADSSDVLSLISGTGRPVREFLLDRFYTSLFEMSLTGPAGWHFPTDTFVAEAERPAATDRDLTLVLKLPRSAPPIVPHDAAVHATRWNTTLPVLRLRLKADATLFQYSALADLVMTSIDLEVKVRGARPSVLHNNLGRLDPSKPFHPFGPMPGRGAYLVLGSEEMAVKPLTALTIRIDWGNLPEDDGGFESWYEGYDTRYPNDGFTITTAVLRDARWEPRSRDGAEQRLFETSRDGGRVLPTSTLELDPALLRNHALPSERSGEDGEFRFDLGTRSGFFRLMLAEPYDTFGHRDYPQLLSRTVAENAKHKHPHPLPNPPYTPLVERLTVDYDAAATIDLGPPAAGQRAAAGEQVFLIHPFGFEEIHPAGQDDSRGPIPRFGFDGNLFIGLEAVDASGPLSLYFELRDEAARAYADGAARPPIRWFYLASNRWRPLGAGRVLSDSTQGFLTSGVVTLDIPGDIDRANTILEPERYWLRVAADGGFDTFAALYGVHAQVLRATRERGPDASAHTPALTPGTIAEPVTSIPGLVAVAQIGYVFAGRLPETPEELKTRTGERLRHKNRAGVYWDYERLVLERFPAVFKVKCFAAAEGGAAAASPGSVTVVVVPEPQPGALDELRAPKLNAVELERIREYLEARASPFARIVVRNPIYERIQVHCAVRFKRGVHTGHCVRRLDRHLMERIWPWGPAGMQARFGWVLRAEEVETWIRELDAVQTVAAVSLLQISESDTSRYTLGDSARAALLVADLSPGAIVQARYPWSLAIPTRHHAIEVLSDVRGLKARPAGIAELEIGNTFIIAVQDA